MKLIYFYIKLKNNTTEILFAHQNADVVERKLKMKKYLKVAEAENTSLIITREMDGVETDVTHLFIKQK